MLQELHAVGFIPGEHRLYATVALSNCLWERPDLRILRRLLAEGANPAEPVYQPGGDEGCAIHVAAMQGNSGAVGIFIENRPAVLEARDGYGNTPLLLAAEAGYEAIVKMLLEKGAQPDTQDRYGNTALTTATSRGHEAVVRRLLRKAADPDIVNDKGGTALIYAAQYGYVGIARRLLLHGARTDIRNNAGKNALMQAALHGHENIVRLFRAHLAGRELPVSVCTICHNFVP